MEKWMKKNPLLFIAFVFLFLGCSSSNFEKTKEIPDDYVYIFVSLDSSKVTIGQGESFTVSSGIVSYNPGWSQSTTLNTVENRNTTVKILTQKGYKVTSDINLADMILIGGYTSNEFRTKVSLTFLDANTEELIFLTEGSYGMGWDIDGDVRGALKNALNSIPQKNSVVTNELSRTSNEVLTTDNTDKIIGYDKNSFLIKFADEKYDLTEYKILSSIEDVEDYEKKLMERGYRKEKSYFDNKNLSLAIREAMQHFDAVGCYGEINNDKDNYIVVNYKKYNLYNTEIFVKN